LNIIRHNFVIFIYFEFCWVFGQAYRVFDILVMFLWTYCNVSKCFAVLVNTVYRQQCQFCVSHSYNNCLLLCRTQYYLSDIMYHWNSSFEKLQAVPVRDPRHRGIHRWDCSSMMLVLPRMSFVLFHITQTLLDISPKALSLARRNLVM
jgi:hypothetical protein